MLWGACDPLTTPRPLGPFHDLAAQLGDDVTTVLRSASQPHEIFTAVFEHLRLHPSVLIVDDLHWADQGTIDLLRFLLRRIRITSSLVVGAMRDDEVGATHPLRSLLGDIARSPDAGDHHAATAQRHGHRRPDRGPPRRPRTGSTSSRGATRSTWPRCSTTTVPRSRARCATRCWPAPAALPTEAWDLLHLLACAPEAIPDHLLAPLDIGLPALRDVDQAGLDPTRTARRRVPARPLPHGDQRHPPARRWGVVPPPPARGARLVTGRRPRGPRPPRGRRRRSRPRAPSCHRGRAGGRPVRRPHAGGRVLRDRARTGCP